jgi:hypothetical protein
MISALLYKIFFVKDFIFLVLLIKYRTVEKVDQVGVHRILSS